MKNRYEQRLTLVGIVNTISPRKSTANGETVGKNSLLDRDGKTIDVTDIRR